ncbi:MAG: HNH endonuclease [Alphaproteobacteria bacterium]|nr:HNH endonuclease [Alphaproteobacteria bacterium]
MSSREWLESPARCEELARAGHRCRLCDRGADEARITVHHRTYSSLGRERPEDLTTLCLECHNEVTSMLRRRRLESLVPPLTDIAKPGWRLARSTIDVVPEIEVHDHRTGGAADAQRPARGSLERVRQDAEGLDQQASEDRGGLHEDG